MPVSRSNLETSTVSQPLKTWQVSDLWFARMLVSERELQKLYKNFSKIDSDKSGTLEPNEFFDIPGKSSEVYPFLARPFLEQNQLVQRIAVSESLHHLTSALSCLARVQ